MNNTSDDELLTLIMLAPAALLFGGASVAGVLFAPVRTWMLEYHLLASGEEVVIPFAEGTGLGWAQIVVAGGILLAFIAGTVAWRRRRAARI